MGGGSTVSTRKQKQQKMFIQEILTETFLTGTKGGAAFPKRGESRSPASILKKSQEIKDCKIPNR